MTDLPSQGYMGMPPKKPSRMPQLPVNTKGAMTMLKLYSGRVTRKQAEACFRLFGRDWPDHPWSKFPSTRTYRRFRRGFRVWQENKDRTGVLGGQWHGMFIGIEPDGHTHS